MARSNTDKEAFVLLSDYIGEYRNKYSSVPLINKYKEKWAMVSILEDFGKENVEKAIVHYFKLNREGHPLNWFFNNFSAIHLSRVSSEKDAELRKEQRKKTAQLRAEHFNGVS